jgi:hypothetical protein
MPTSGNRYGWTGFNREIHRMKLPSGNHLIEVPLSVVDLFGRTLPACGGGYLRYFPYAMTRQSFLKIQKERPVIVYMHPYELDTEKYPDFFYRAKSSLGLRKRLPLSFYRVNKGTVKRKLDRLIGEFPFKPIINIIEDYERDSR